MTVRNGLDTKEMTRGQYPQHSEAWGTSDLPIHTHPKREKEKEEESKKENEREKERERREQNVTTVLEHGQNVRDD